MCYNAVRWECIIMGENRFVNDFLSLGMSSFFKKDKVNIFEAHVVECLCDIYGIEKIKRAYETSDDLFFTTTVHMYGFTRTLYDNF